MRIEYGRNFDCLYTDAGKPMGMRDIRSGEVYSLWKIYSREYIKAAFRSFRG